MRTSPRRRRSRDPWVWRRSPYGHRQLCHCRNRLQLYSCVRSSQHVATDSTAPGSPHGSVSQWSPVTADARPVHIVMDTSRWCTWRAPIQHATACRSSSRRRRRRRARSLGGTPLSSMQRYRWRRRVSAGMGAAPPASHAHCIRSACAGSVEANTRVSPPGTSSATPPWRVCACKASQAQLHEGRRHGTRVL